MAVLFKHAFFSPAAGLCGPSAFAGSASLGCAVAQLYLSRLGLGGLAGAGGDVKSDGCSEDASVLCLPGSPQGCLGVLATWRWLSLQPGMGHGNRRGNRGAMVSLKAYTVPSASLPLLEASH